MSNPSRPDPPKASAHTHRKEPPLEPPADRVVWFREVVRRHERMLVRYTTAIVRGDVEKAREIVQETFLRLWRSSKDQTPDHLRAWLLTVCRNQALDVLRREERMQPATDYEEEQRPSTAPSPHAVVEQQRTLRSVFTALERLPEKNREVIRLKFQQGLSYKEISRVTGHSVSYVGVLIHEGMKTLRHWMHAQHANTSPPASSPHTAPPQPRRATQ